MATLVIQDDSRVRGGELCSEKVIDVLTIFGSFIDVLREEEDKEESGSIPCSHPFSGY